jgi:hypothetical protein
VFLRSVAGGIRTTYLSRSIIADDDEDDDGDMSVEVPDLLLSSSTWEPRRGVPRDLEVGRLRFVGCCGSSVHGSPTSLRGTSTLTRLPLVLLLRPDFSRTSTT